LEGEWPQFKYIEQEVDPEIAAGFGTDNPSQASPPHALAGAGETIYEAVQTGALGEPVASRQLRRNPCGAKGEMSILPVHLRAP